MSFPGPLFNTIPLSYPSAPSSPVALLPATLCQFTGRPNPRSWKNSIYLTMKSYTELGLRPAAPLPKVIWLSQTALTTAETGPLADPSRMRMQLRYQFAHRQNCILGKCDRPHLYPEKRGTARWALTTVLRFREILKHSNTASFILSFPELVPGSLAASTCLQQPPLGISSVWLLFPKARLSRSV